MAVRFILGRSGSGKTTCCIDAIVDALQEVSSQPLILLVPEQATYQAERAILSDQRVKGYHRLHILSFDRLQFLLLGKSTARPTISRLGRQMIVHKILRDIRDDLQIFRASAPLPGFACEVAETITELHRYARTPEEMGALPAQLPTGRAGRLAALKFADIGLIFARYSEFLRGRFVDPDAHVNDACKKVGQADFLKGARLWVDGFAGFTGGEMVLLIELLKTVEEAHIALCLDPVDIGPKDGPNGLFEPTLRTYRELCEALDAARIGVVKPIVLKQAARFASSPALAHVERHIFQLGTHPIEVGDSIRLVSAPDIRAEVHFVAGQVRRLVQQCGYRYRDIAVVASDLGRYEHYVRAYFADYAIPFFIDKRKGLNQHPVVELIGAALQAVTGGFAHADVFAYLKTDLAAVERCEVDVLENYCLAFGVDRRDWADADPWRFAGPDDGAFDEREIERIRKRAAAPLCELGNALGLASGEPPTLTAADFTLAVWAFLERLQVRQKVSAWVGAAQQEGDTLADEHRQFWDRLMDIFDELSEVFARDEMTAQDYLAVLNMAFSQMTLGVIPPSLDQVLVGSIERSRHPNLKAVFLLGVTQKPFPIALPSTGVLTDEDRGAAEEAGCHLAPPSTQALTERQYLAYIAFTRPSALLCLSYPSVDEKGSPLVRSHFAKELQALFVDLAEESVADNGAGVDDACSQLELAERLCSHLGRDVFAPPPADDEPLVDLLEALRADEDGAPTSALVAAALHYDNRAVLDDEVAGRLLGRRLKSSATRLATFAACPFKHFVKYVLELKPRREFKLQPLDLGNFYHEVLDALHKRLATEGLNFATADDDRLRRLLGEQIAAFAETNAFLSKFVARSKHNAFIISNAAEVLENCVLDTARMSRAGAFRPLLSEVAFGDVKRAQDSLGKFELTLPDGRTLTLSGKIDRLDVAEIDGRKAALVFDYKTSTAGSKFHWPEFYHGLNVQLPMYLLAVLNAAGSRVDAVAGAFCLPIHVPTESASLERLSPDAETKPRKANGLFNGQYARSLDPDAGSRWSKLYNFGVTKDQGQYGYYANSGVLRPADFEKLLQFARDKIVTLASGIVSGAVDVHPYRLGTQVACSNCECRPVCRFDWQVNDYHFLDAKGKLDVLDEVKGR